MTAVTALAMVGIAVIVTVAAIDHGFMIAVFAMKGGLMVSMTVNGALGWYWSMMPGMSVGWMMGSDGLTGLADLSGLMRG
ncbi:hypothetical protein RJ45_21505 [Photobacterium gaetbulicola]|uniref:Uncharacterized protein n=1 Tax=Photobacterium gaetbulicola TaxID=1295392 RepID=A0A0B9G9Y0_9GAMM|nr:hypothetical protein [Photobacterium gaetbulicola]KHT61690.1 hypothetical protein RJ45_21505 [Photobacterium gaetbulicola]